MPKMRAKMVVTGFTPWSYDGKKQGENLTFVAVAASQYPEDGSDENNTYAKYSPAAQLHISVANPALFDQFEVNDVFYVDFTPAK